MTVTVRCSQGHHWQIPQEQVSNDTTALHCPECGSPPTPDQMAPKATGEMANLETAVFESEWGDDPTKMGLRGDNEISTEPADVDPEDQPTFITDKNEVVKPLAKVAIPGYQFLSELGRGGMGIVYKARQKGLNRLVALKMLHAHSAAPEKTLARFNAEAQAIAHLHHANIVQIYEIGEFDGKPFLTLEYVDGGNLARKLRDISYAPRQAAQLIETLAQAVHYAHEEGILHRDLKPGNILLTKNGVPKITDFGLVKRIEDLQKQTGANRLTDTGEIIGTPSYMAPEQAAALSSEFGPATDVYALGAILYELLTHQPPFDADTPMRTVMEVLEKDPTPPQQLQDNIPRDLQTICLTCLEKDPARRYTRAADLAEDLRAFLAGEPIVAKPPNTLQRMLEATRRRPVVALAIGVGFVALVAIIIGAMYANSIATAGIAVVSLVVAAWWYNARLQKALLRASEEHLHAERNIERLNLLLETTQQLMKTSDLDEILTLLSETTTRMANAERATIFLVDDEKAEIWSRVALGENVGTIRVKLGEGVAGTVAVNGEVIVISDPYGDPRFNPEIDRRTGYKTRNLLTLPMKSSDRRIVGVFQVLNKRTGAFEPEDIQLLQALAASAALAVEKSQRERKK